MAKDTIAIFVWFAVLMGMALLARVPLGHLADPTDLSYIPRPEWYFLFLFQFLKWFEGPLEVVGAVILPTLAIIALLLVPFIDRGKMKMVRQRTGAIGVVVLAAIFWGGLTAARRSHHSRNARDGHVASPALAGNFSRQHGLDRTLPQSPMRKLP